MEVTTEENGESVTPKQNSGNRTNHRRGSRSENANGLQNLARFCSFCGSENLKDIEENKVCGDCWIVFNVTKLSK